MEFYVHVISSFVIAGSLITLASIIAEKLGTKLGGLLTNLPSNILVTLIFIALTQGTNYAAESTRAIPVGLIIDTIFLLTVILTLNRGLAYSLSVSLSIWLLLAVVANHVKISNFLISVPIYFVVTILVFYYIERNLKISSVSKATKKYTFTSLALRAIFAGSIVAITVIIGNYFGPYVTGLVSTFPAVIISTLSILYFAQGIKFTRALAKIMVFSTSNIIVYSLSIYFTYPLYGITIGTIISFILSFTYVWLFFPILRKLQ